jgi:hypothetical protein
LAISNVDSLHQHWHERRSFCYRYDGGSRCPQSAILHSVVCKNVAVCFSLCIRAGCIMKHPLNITTRNKSVLMMRVCSGVLLSGCTADGSFRAYSRSNLSRTKALSLSLSLSNCTLLNPCSCRGVSGNRNFLFQQTSFLPLRQHTLRFQFANGEPTCPVFDTFSNYIAPSKCSTTISSLQLAEDTEMILRAARILVTVLSVTFWQQCLSGYTYGHPQVPFTVPDITSGYTNQVCVPASQ